MSLSWLLSASQEEEISKEATDEDDENM